MNHLPLIIKREYLTKVRNKSFIVMTILSPIIMIVLISVVAYLSELNKENIIFHLENRKEKRKENKITQITKRLCNSFANQQT